MKIKRAVLTGIVVWIIAVFLYSISYYVPIIDDADMQANVVLFVVVVPLVWLGCSFYYRKDNKTHGYKIGLIMLSISIVLDTLITVPVFIIPYGGDYYSFFISISFWAIAFEFVVVAILYWYACVYSPKMLLQE